MCFPLCGHFGFLLLCQHMLRIRTYVIQFISLYFVPLSGLLITSILSLKCNYGHHVMFSMEMHLVQKAGRDPSAWQSFHRWKTKTCSKKWMAEFLMFLITTRRTRILTSVLKRNPHITGHIQKSCTVSAAKRCMMESLKLSPKWK